MESHPMTVTYQEHRITVDGVQIVLQISNVPVVKSYNRIISSVSELAEIIAESSVDAVSKLRTLQGTLSDAIIKLEEMEKKSETASQEIQDPSAFMEEYENMLNLVQNLTAAVKLEKAAAELKKYETIPMEALKRILSIICPTTKITDRIAESITFVDMLEIGEKFIKVNKLDVIPKKLIPQSLVQNLKEAVSGVMQSSGF